MKQLQELRRLLKSKVIIGLVAAAAILQLDI
jgi:hypothetical protein